MGGLRSSVSWASSLSLCEEFNGHVNNKVQLSCSESNLVNRLTSAALVSKDLPAVLLHLRDVIRDIASGT